jgi:hypothetical protein
MRDYVVVRTALASFLAGRERGSSPMDDEFFSDEPPAAVEDNAADQTRGVAAFFFNDFPALDREHVVLVHSNGVLHVLKYSNFRVWICVPTY